MSYTICISPSCPSCQEILHLLEDMRVYVKIKNMQYETDCKVAIVPALFKEKSLIAYGKDIISYFKNKNSHREVGYKKSLL